MKKLLNLALVLVMLLVQIVPVSAATNPGSITITGAIKGQKYSIYQILDLESYDNSREAYTYKATSEWSSFINSSNVKGVYVNVDKQGYVTWIKDADVVAFSKAALKHAKDNKIDATKEETAAQGSTTVEFTGLELGYYLVDSSLGALCGLTTTKPSASVIEKNSETSVVKEVQEGNNWGSISSAKIGDEVFYKTTITISDEPEDEIYAGSENYVLYDKMSEGLTFNDNIVVTLNTTDNEGKAVLKTLVKNTDYKMIPNADYTFVIDFEKSFEDTLKQNDVIVVTYSATLNEKAVMFDNVKSDPTNNEVGANTNKAEFVYGDENKITSTTKTYSYTFDLVKIDQDGNLLTGAKFELYDSEKNGNKIEVVLVDADSNTYRIATSDETGVVIDLTRVATATIIGLDSNTTYYLEETVVPDGYNRLASRVSVAMLEENLDASITKNEVEGKIITTITGGVQVRNTKGNLLPSTGGIGTVIFITVGSIMVLGFGLLLVAKLRLSKEEM